MSIDTGQSLSFNPNFPIPNIDQPSQQFRDNFQIIKSAIENLQIASSDTTSTLNISTVQGTGGDIHTNATFINNGFMIPIGSPSAGSPAAGMIKYDSGTQTVQYYNGAAWLPVVFKDSTGLVTLSTLTISTKLTLNFTPTAGTDAVNVSYLNTQLSAQASNTATQISQINSNVATLQTDLVSETTTRTQGESNLANSIAIIQDQISNGSSTSNSITLQLTSLTQNLTDETNARVLGDGNLTNTVSSLNDRVGNVETLSSTVQSNLVQEISDRTTGDQNLYNIINSVSTAQTTTANGLVDEANTRSSQYTLLTTAITQLNANVSIEASQRIANDAAITTSLGAYMPIAGGTITGDINVSFSNVGVTNGNVTVTSGSLVLPQSNVILDAGHYLFLQGLPDGGGGGDGAYITFDQNNFAYGIVDSATQAAIAADIAANGIANANTHWELSCLRIGTGNDPAGNAGDSMAFEPSANLFLNPGWVGNYTDYQPRVPFLANAAIYVGNATTFTVKIERQTGNITSNGNIIGAGTVASSSDASLKYNVRKIESALDKIDQLTGVLYNRNDLEGNPEQMGLIAQDARPIVPQVVHEQYNGLLAVSYGNLTALIIEAIKEIRVEINDLKNR
jgi:hypothetical protein